MPRIALLSLILSVDSVTNPTWALMSLVLTALDCSDGRAGKTSKCGTASLGGGKIETMEGPNLSTFRNTICACV